ALEDPALRRAVREVEHPQELRRLVLGPEAELTYAIEHRETAPRSRVASGEVYHRGRGVTNGLRARRGGGGKPPRATRLLAIIPGRDRALGDLEVDLPAAPRAPHEHRVRARRGVDRHGLVRRRRHAPRDDRVRVGLRAAEDVEVEVRAARAV